MNFLGFSTSTYVVNTYTTGTYNLYLTDVGQQDLNANPVTQSLFWKGSNYLEIEYDTSSTNPLEGSEAHALGNVYVSMPTSTYVTSSISSLVPAFAFSSTGTLSDAKYLAATMDSLMGAATSTVPFCFAYPWFRFFDTVIGSMDGLAPETLTVAAFGGESLTLDLSDAGDQFAASGVGLVWQTLVDYFVAAMWLAFGVYVFKDLFEPNVEAQE